MQFSYRVINNNREFEDLELNWRDLLTRSDTKSIYLTWEWVFAWWQSFGSGCDLAVFCVSDATTGQMLGIAPLCIQVVKKKGIRLKELTFLDNNLTAADHLDFIVDSRYKSEVICTLLQLILSTEKHWDVIRFGSVIAESDIVPTLKNLVGNNELLQIEDSKCPYIQLPDNFENLYLTLSKKKRKNVRRYQRAWEDYPDVVLFPVDNERALGEAVESLIQLNIERQKNKGKTSTLETREFQNFLSLISSTFLKNGWLRMYKMVLGEEILAVDYGFQFREKFFAYSGGYRAEWSHLNPGHVMLEHSIKHAIEEGIKEYDLLRGVQSYKYDWANSEREDIVIKFPVSMKGNIIFHTKNILGSIDKEIISRVNN